MKEKESLLSTVKKNFIHVQYEGRQQISAIKLCGPFYALELDYICMYTNSYYIFKMNTVNYVSWM